MTRVLLLTGKGGVGKTTVAAATGLAAAGDNQVLVTSTDPAHSLADAFGVPLGDRPRRVAEGLDAQQIHAQARLERHWHHVRDYLVQLLAWGGMSEVQAEELVLFPGLDEIFSLVELRRHLDEKVYDLVVVDCAPTAATLRLLALPDAVRWYVDRVVAPGRHVARAVRPVVSRVSDLPMPRDQVFGAVERLHRDLLAVHRVLQDPAVTSVRLVVTPERLVVNETLRSATTLSLFGYPVDAVVANRLLPDGLSDPYLVRWRARQSGHLRSIRRSFAPLPVLTAPRLADEPVGVDALTELGARLWADHDPAARLTTAQPVRLERCGTGWRLVISLPFASREDIDLHRRGGYLHVTVDGVRRTVRLPAAVRRHAVEGARLTDGTLEIRFVHAGGQGTPTAGQPRSRTVTHENGVTHEDGTATSPAEHRPHITMEGR